MDTVQQWNALLDRYNRAYMREWVDMKRTYAGRLQVSLEVPAPAYVMGSVATILQRCAQLERFGSPDDIQWDWNGVIEGRNGEITYAPPSAIIYAAVWLGHSCTRHIAVCFNIFNEALKSLDPEAKHCTVPKLLAAWERSKQSPDLTATPAEVDFGEAVLRCGRAPSDWYRQVFHKAYMVAKTNHYVLPVAHFQWGTRVVTKESKK
jgi:hypothetical protein